VRPEDRVGSMGLEGQRSKVKGQSKNKKGIGFFLFDL
jgi:hypothetical protein